MKYSVLLLGLLPAVAAAESKRSLDAHEHGAGNRDIAITGGDIAMMLEVPGADIVGFEHAAETTEDRAAVESAILDLEKPLDLFVIGADAGCSVVEAHAMVAGEDEDHDHHEHESGHADEHHEEHSDDHASEHDDHDHDDHGDDHAEAHDDDHDGHAEESHNEFHVEYRLNCANPDAIDRIEFAYFERFPNARELDLQIATDSGATAIEVERDAPYIELKGMF